MITKAKAVRSRHLLSTQWTILPILELPQWLWLWAGVIVAIKVVNQFSTLVMYGHCCFPNTLANKVTGFLLFITVPMTFWSIIPITIVASVATYAAIHEGHYIRMNKIKSRHYCMVLLARSKRKSNDVLNPC